MEALKYGALGAAGTLLAVVVGNTAFVTTKSTAVQFIIKLLVGGGVVAGGAHLMKKG